MFEPSQRYDPYVLPTQGDDTTQRNDTGPGPSKTSTVQGDNNKRDGIERDLDSAVRTMRDNLAKVADRGERLDGLQDKTDRLGTSASGFRKGANRVRKNMWLKDMKMRIIIGTAITVILIIIIVSIVKATESHH